MIILFLQKKKRKNTSNHSLIPLDIINQIEPRQLLSNTTKFFSFCISKTLKNHFKKYNNNNNKWSWKKYKNGYINQKKRRQVSNRPSKWKPAILFFILYLASSIDFTYSTFACAKNLKDERKMSKRSQSDITKDTSNY